jgi:hypothetical protein
MRKNNMKDEVMTDRKERNLREAELHLKAVRHLRRHGGREAHHADRAADCTENALAAHRGDSRLVRSVNGLEELKVR